MNNIFENIINFIESNLLISNYIILIIVFIISKKIFLKISKVYIQSRTHITYDFLDFIIFLPILSYIIKMIYNKNFDTFLFLGVNIFILFYFFIRLRLPGKAWELIILNKHSKAIDSYMVVIGLVFASIYSIINSFKIEYEYFSNFIIMLLIFFIFLSINFIIMMILIFFSLNIMAIMKSGRYYIFPIVLIMFIGLLMQETLNYNKAYNEYLSHRKVEVNATKK